MQVSSLFKTMPNMTKIYKKKNSQLKFFVQVALSRTEVKVQQSENAKEPKINQ